VETLAPSGNRSHFPRSIVEAGRKIRPSGQIGEKGGVKEGDKLRIFAR